MGRAAEVVAPSSSIRTDGGCPVVQVNDLSRSLAAFDPISTLVVVVEMSKASWLVSSVVPGVERQPLKSYCIIKSSVASVLPFVLSSKGIAAES
jgi:transposase